MNRRSFLLGLYCLTLASCTRQRHEKHAVRLPTEELPWLLCLAVEGSLFADRDTSGHVWKAINKIRGDFFRNVEDGKIVVARISDDAEAIRWKGSGRSWRRELGSFAAFDQKILSGTRYYGKRVYANLADCAEYLTDRHQESTVERSGFIYFSRGQNEAATERADRDRLVASMRKYIGVSKGSCLLGGYWMDRHAAHKLRDLFREAGFTKCKVEDQLDPDPQMPSWEG